MGKSLRKAGVVALLLIVLGWLFWQTVQDSLSEPFVIEPGLVAEWRLALRGPMQSGAGLLTLQPTDQLRAELFQQIFTRTMESMTSPAEASMPIVLHSEYRDTLGTVFSPDDILAAAEEAGLSNVTPMPVCIGVAREAVVGASRQLYFAVFESPEVDRFRQGLARRYADSDGETSFDHGELVLAVPIAASDGNFASWWPLDVRTETDCQAPLTAGGASTGQQPQAE